MRPSKEKKSEERNYHLGTNREKAEKIERCNLGYFAGYCNQET